VGEIEGAELLLVGSLTTLEAQESGGGIGGMLSDFAGDLTGTALGSSDVEVSWKSAKAAMEIRLIDVRTSRVVLAATVEGKARSMGGSASTYAGGYDTGMFPSSFEAYKDTPVEKAFREMVASAVKYMMKQTPENYYHEP
jgi:curli biogenesis system outer membrane secretion channel CsgG